MKNLDLILLTNYDGNNYYVIRIEGFSTSGKKEDENLMVLILNFKGVEVRIQRTVD